MSETKTLQNSIERSAKRPLVILTGPTAVGKTALSISLAKAINGKLFLGFHGL